MAAKDNGADTFDVLGVGVMDDGVDHAGPSLQHSNEFPHVPIQINSYDDVLRFIVLEEEVFVGVNKWPWVEPT